ncbi:MAG: hypothetical protein E7388_03650 [Ruminococcaceae bacterium]|nr:hypothetical protein [Oscillospiraceae bacterium]
MKFAITSAKLKIIGMITMVLLNLAMLGVVTQPVLKYFCGIVGSASLTIFAFLISEGYRHTSNINKYVLRVLIFAIIAAFPQRAILFIVNEGKTDLSAYFNAGLSAFLCLTVISTYDKLKEKSLRYALMGMMCFLSFVLNFYAAPFVFVLMFIIHINRENFPKMAYYITTLYLSLFAVGVFFKLTNSGYNGGNLLELDQMIYQVGCILPLPLLYKYNGQEGVKLKWIVYTFYPLTLVIIMLLLHLR